MWNWTNYLDFLFKKPSRNQKVCIPGLGAFDYAVLL